MWAQPVQILLFAGKANQPDALPEIRTVGGILQPPAKHQFEATELFVFQGLGRQAVDLAKAGDIVAVAGIPDVAIGDTITDAATPEALPRLAITEPTVQLTMLPNTSPFAGQDGKAVTSRQLHERLVRELETNVGLRLRQDAGDNVRTPGRGVQEDS